jgi:hypothetical protein
VTVPDESMVARATEILRRYNPIDVDRRATQWKQTGWTGFDNMAEPYTAVDLAEERKHYPSSVETEEDTAVRRYPTTQP